MSQCPHFNPHDICPECPYKNDSYCICCLKGYPLIGGCGHEK